MTIWGYTHTRTHTLIPLIIKTIQAYIRCIFKIIFPIIYSGRIFFLFFNFCTPLDFIFWDFTPEIYDNTANTGSHNLHKKKTPLNTSPPPLFSKGNYTQRDGTIYIIFSVCMDSFQGENVRGHTRVARLLWVDRKAKVRKTKLATSMQKSISESTTLKQKGSSSRRPRQVLFLYRLQFTRSQKMGNIAWSNDTR